MKTPLSESVVPMAEKIAGLLGSYNGQAECLSETVEQEGLPFVSPPLQAAGTVSVTYRYVGQLRPRPHTFDELS